MTFVDSVRICFVKYADFNGRAGKSEFWWWALFNVIGIVSLGIVSDRLSWAFNIATLLPYFAVTSRRLHDIDKSGWLQLIGLIPIIGWAVLIYWCVQDSKEPNRFSQLNAV